MVLVSNEWQNKSEDVPKTTANTTATAGTNTTATTSAAATVSFTETSISTAAATATATSAGTVVNAETVAGDSKNSLILETTAIPAATTILNKNDNANNEQLHEIVKDKTSIEIVYNNEVIEGDNINEYKIKTEVDQLAKQEDNLKETVSNYTNSIKIMAENTKESPLKEDKESEDLQDTLINSSNNHTENNKELEKSNSYPNSNTSTLTTTPTSIIKPQQNNQQQNIITQQQEVPLTCPITSQALSDALQTALNATNNANNANTVAAAGLQPNFLSQLAFTANVAGLQKSTNNTTSAAGQSLTAKQLNQSFHMLDLNNQNRSDSNLLERLSTTSTVTPSSVTTSVPAVSYDNNGQAKIVLICEGNSHPFQTRTIILTPNVECMVGRLIAKSKASENNAIFDCKVLSRKHAVIWYTPDGKFWVKDTKSSNGTFINDNKLGDEEAELHFGDIVKFGVDVMENSRKEIHGCIIACVKLFLPDGREAISIDSSAHRSQYSTEGRIGYDEMQRLNLYIQETSQREKILTSKLCNIQNVLDATRKNSALCWQSMITEDQLLHRIHSLEKKLQFMEKNVPENVLRNEVLKLLEDKNSYQHTAKEALRKVYQERCDAIQTLAKMESAYTQSDNECSLLREQIMNSKQALQEVNSRLLRLETEYNEYKDEMARQQQEAKEHEEQRIIELTEKLRERELEGEDLKKKISELLIKRAELIENEEQLLEKQAIEKLDAAIADVDLGDDEDSSDDDNENSSNDVVDVEKSQKKRSDSNGKHVDVSKEENEVEEDDKDVKFAVIKKKTKTRLHITSIFGDKLNGIEEDKSQDKCKLKKGEAFETLEQKSPPKRVKETIIRKWLQNSDLNKNEDSCDIFKAICQENEYEDDEEPDSERSPGISTEQEFQDAKPKSMSDDITNELKQKCSDFTIKLSNVQTNLKQLKAVIEKESTRANGGSDDGKVKIKQEIDEGDSSDEEEGGACAEKDFIIKGNGGTGTSNPKLVLSEENKKYLLLESSFNMLKEAYNEIWNIVKERKEKEPLQLHDEKEKSPPADINYKTQFRTSPNVLDSKIYNSQSSEIVESDSEIESLNLSSLADSSLSATVLNVKTYTSSDQLLREKLKEHQNQVEALNKKLQQTELEAQHTLELMQVECDDVKLKMENLNEIIEGLRNDKKALEQVINENKNNTEKTSEISKTQHIDERLDEEFELEEDVVLDAISVTALEREEELITYKERLDEQQRENIDLRNEIAKLIQEANAAETTKDILLKQYLPCSFIIVAIIVYFLTTYY